MKLLEKIEMFMEENIFIFQCLTSLLWLLAAKTIFKDELINNIWIVFICIYLFVFAKTPLYKPSGLIYEDELEDLKKYIALVDWVWKNKCKMKTI